MATNTVALRDNGTRKALWKERLMPASYQGGFVMTRIDVNGDKTPDYVLVTKKGPTILFIVDGRTGAVTRVRGPIDPAFRHPFRIQSGNFAAGGGTQLLIHGLSTKTGAVMLVDLATDRLVWSRRWPLPGTLRYKSVDAREAGRGYVRRRDSKRPVSEEPARSQWSDRQDRSEARRASGSSISAQDLSQSRLDDVDGEPSRIKVETPRAAVSIAGMRGNPHGVPKQFGKSVTRVSFASRRGPSR